MGHINSSEAIKQRQLERQVEITSNQVETLFQKFQKLSDNLSLDVVSLGMRVEILEGKRKLVEQEDITAASIANLDFELHFLDVWAYKHFQDHEEFPIIIGRTYLFEATCDDPVLSPLIVTSWPDQNSRIVMVRNPATGDEFAIETCALVWKPEALTVEQMTSEAPVDVVKEYESHLDRTDLLSLDSVQQVIQWGIYYCEEQTEFPVHENCIESLKQWLSVRAMLEGGLASLDKSDQFSVHPDVSSAVDGSNDGPSDEEIQQAFDRR